MNTQEHQWTKEDLQPIQYAVGAVLKNGDRRLLTFFHNKLGKYSIPVGKVPMGMAPTEAGRKMALCQELEEELARLIAMGSE